MAAGQALTFAGLLWLIYIALEPFVRRRWPHMLVSWTRLLSGAFGDQCGEQRATNKAIFRPTLISACV
jgi:hypothetical protein